MLRSPDYRITLLDRQPPAAPSELEAVFVGGAAAQARPEAAVEARQAAAQLGFGRADDESLGWRPLAFSNAAAFSAAFPGDDGWLFRAVRDYFNAGGRRAWVVRIDVDDAQPLDAYFRHRPIASQVQQPAGGIDIAMQVPDAGLLVLPDLEHLCLAASLPSSAALPPAAPTPAAFRPIADFIQPRPPMIAPVPQAARPVQPNEILTSVSTMLSLRRPDMLCLFTLPIGADQRQSVHALVQRADRYLHGDARPGPDLGQVQVFAPLLRYAAGDIASASGLVAGFLTTLADSAGIWRSIGGRALPLGMTPLRRIESSALDELRRSGVATVRFGPGGTAIDDDILALRDDPANADRRAAGTRRLIGWLLRALKRYGEQLVFENVLDDGRVELVLADLFATLHKRGALNGRQVSDAVNITRREAAEAAVAFDIGINAAVAVETIRLQFLDGAVTTTLGATA